MAESSQPWLQFTPHRALASWASWEFSSSLFIYGYLSDETRPANQSVERTGMSRSAQKQSRRQWRLTPIAHLFRSAASRAARQAVFGQDFQDSLDWSIVY